MHTGTFFRSGTLLVATLVSCTATPANAVDPFELVRAAIRLPCLAPPGTDIASLSKRLPGTRSKTNWVRYSPEGIVARRMVLEAGADELAIEFKGPPGAPDYVTALYLAGALRQPRLVARADESCTIHTALQLSHDAAGRPEWLQDLDHRLRPVGEPEPLNPPVPAGHDPPGILVAMIDSGVNYLLPEILSRLARDQDGQILGYDYWDLDRRPFDAEPTSDPFHPGRHGTLVASLLLEEAPVVKLVPYRYPRPDLARMTALIEDAAAHGVRVVNLSLVTTSRAPWLPFETAARAHPEMLFVVAAGNHGDDLDRHPAYPAALDLANVIVVTSATADGRLTTGVNWGAQLVDLMAPGEEVVALDFDGARRRVSGSSYATARVSALAACLLADHPEWSSAELKAAVFRQAQGGRAEQVAHGFLPQEVLGNRRGCRKTLADCRGSSPGC